MANNKISELSNPFSTGGGGVTFECETQALFLLLLALGSPCLIMKEPITKICFQARRLGFHTDDLVVFTSKKEYENKLLCQVKRSITATKENKVFKKVVTDAWLDFNSDFDRENDKIALITANISAPQLSSLKHLNEYAKAANNERDFFDRIARKNYSNSNDREMLEILKSAILSVDNNMNDVDFWLFCKVFVVLQLDLDSDVSANKDLAIALINNNSSISPDFVWPKLFELATEYNKAAATIDKGMLDKRTDGLLFANINKTEFASEPKKDLFTSTITLIGSWRGENEYDRQLISKLSNMDYLEFEAKAKNMLNKHGDYIEYKKGVWKIKQKRHLLKRCGALMFDENIERLFMVAKEVLSQKEKSIIEKNNNYIYSCKKYNNSCELRKNIVQSLCLLTEMSKEFPHCDGRKIENNAYCLVKDLLKDADWSTWLSLNDCLLELAELSPDAYLDNIEDNAINNKEELLKLFPRESDNVFSSSNYSTQLLLSLEKLAWSPKYFIKSICVLGVLETIPYEKTSWSNTPLNSIVSILLPWYPQTMADFEMRKTALICLKNDNSNVYWSVIKKLLPNKTTTTSDNPKPNYLGIEIPNKIVVYRKELHESYDYLLALAVDYAVGKNDDMLYLAETIKYMDKSTLMKYLSNLEKDAENYSEEEAFSMRLKLKNLVVKEKPTKDSLIYEQIPRIEALINQLRPKNMIMKYREMFVNNSWMYEGKKVGWMQSEAMKTNAVKEIFEKHGILEVEKFGVLVKNPQDISRRLGEVITTNDLSNIINMYCLNEVPQEFVVGCINGFINKNNAKELLNTTLCDKEKNIVLDILSKVYYRKELYETIIELGIDDNLYWGKANMPFMCLDDDCKELKFIVSKLIDAKRYITAMNILGRTNTYTGFISDEICSLLERAATIKTNDESKIDEYAVNNLISFLQENEQVDMDKLSNIEFIYLPLLRDDCGCNPKTIYKKLGSDPKCFCDLIEAYYKKERNQQRTTELDKTINERLFDIVLKYKAIPGMKNDGSIDANEFKKWMDYVRKWSEENHVYKEAMYIVGIGLSFAKLNNEGFPELLLIEEINKAQNKDLRVGYEVGVMNQRGVHVVDPTGKEEIEIASKYSDMANAIERKGYKRYADALRNISKQYEKEAQLNIEIYKESLEN